MKMAEDRYFWENYSYIVCMSLCLFFSFQSTANAAISTVGAEQSGTTSSVIEHVGAGSFASINNCGNIAPSTPAGNVGDLLIAVALVRETNATVTASAGWTQYYTENHGVGSNQDLEAYIFYRIADNTAADSVTLTSGGTGNCRSLIGQVSRFDGVNTASPFETNPILAGNSSTQNTGNVTTGTDTTIDANAMLLVATFINDNAVVTEVDGFTASFDSPSTLGRDSAISLNYRQESSAGPKGAFTWSQNLGPDESIGVLFALTPDNSIQGISVNVPTGTTTDDVMIAAIAVGPDTTGITAPAGWTLINRQDQTLATSNSQAIYYRVATASEPASYNWTFSGGAVNGSAGGIVTYRGVDTASVIDDSGSQATASGTSHAAPSINTTIANAMIVVAYSYSSSENWTEPPSMAEQVDVVSAGTPAADGISLGMADVIQVSIGPTPTHTATAAGNADTGVVNVIALTPLVFSETIAVNFSANINSVMAGSLSLLNAAVGVPEDNNSSTSTSGTTVGPTNLTASLNAWLIDSAVSEDSGSFSFAGQNEIWEETNGGATGVMSTREDVAAGANSMSQTHTSGGTNRMAHVAVSVAPVSGNLITLDASASTNDSGNTVSWTHSLASSSTANIKILVAIAFEESGACNDTINSVTYGNTNLTQVVQEQISGGGSCKQVEIWYGDITSIIVSTDRNQTLGGQAMDQDEAVEYVAVNDSGNLFLNDATFDSNARLDALHQYDNENIAVSVAGNGEAVGGNAIPNGSVAILTPTATAGIYNFGSILFDESNFASGNENIDAVYVRDNGNVVLSTNNNANLPGIGNFDDDDIVEWDGSTASLIFNIASIAGAANNWNVDALHFLDDDPNLILFSLYNDRTIGPTSYLNGDVLLYDRNTSTLSVYFSESNFAPVPPDDKDVDAVTLSVPPFAGNVIDHYDIDFSSGTGITCLPVSVTITAKDDSDATVSHSSNTTIDFNVSTNLGQWATTPSVGTGIITDPTPGTPDNGDLQYEFPSGESSVTIPLSYTQLTGGTSDTFEIDITTTPDEDGGIADANDDPTIDFFLTGIVFNNVTDGNNIITTQISGKPSDTGFESKVFNLQVLNADDNDPSVCNSIFGPGDVVNIDLGVECKNPSACAGNELNIDNINPALPVNGIDITTSDDDTDPATVAAYEPGGVDLQFGADSAAEIVLTYPDAGSLELHARYELLLDDGVTGSGDFATGISNAFVVRPFGFDIDSGGLRAADWLDNNALDDSTTTNTSYAADATGSVFANAGHLTNTFPVTVRAVVWDNNDDVSPIDGVADSGANLTDNNTTPNFGQETSTELVDVTVSNVRPTNVGTLFFGQDLDFSVNTVGSGLSGTLTTNLAFDEVGIIDLSAALDSGDYLSGGDDATSTHQDFGRFIPDRFTIADNSPVMENSCVAGNFTYMDQVFYYESGNEPSITVTAVNENGDTTVNYGTDGTAANNYWRLPAALARTYDDNSINNGATFNDTNSATVILTGDNDFDGEGVLTLSNVVGDRDTFMFDRAGVDLSAGEGAPFDASIDLLIQVTVGSLTDTDGVCYDGDNDGTCEIDGSDDYDALTDTGGTDLTLSEIRFGRFVINNAVGSELLDLSPLLHAEYYDGNNFIVNTNDTCTFEETDDVAPLDLQDHLRLSNPDTAGGALQAGDAAMTIGAGSTSITTFNEPLSGGDVGTVFSAPGEGNTGFVIIDGNLACNEPTVACGGTVDYDHLLYDWDDDGAFDDEPTGRIDFGIYQGNKNLIYIRESF